MFAALTLTGGPMDKREITQDVLQHRFFETCVSLAEPCLASDTMGAFMRGYCFAKSEAVTVPTDPAEHEAAYHMAAFSGAFAGGRFCANKK
jgi:hypothetical protein